MTKCPYVPPHEFNLDFPHLMLRYRAIEKQDGKVDFASKQLAETDRNGKLAGMVDGLANWASDENNKLTRPLMETVAGIHKDAALPKFHGNTFAKQASKDDLQINRDAPAAGRKVAIYATCFANYNNPDIGNAARRVLGINGVESEVVYPSCCGMPFLEQGDLAAVAENARKVSKEMVAWIDRGYDIIALVPSCALMLKFEWPLILPDDENVKRLSAATFDISEYIVDIAKKEGLADGMKDIGGGVTLHLSCHARAQNMGAKGAELLRAIPDTKVEIIDRCSGHGGAWGIKKENFDTAIKIGRPAARTALKQGQDYVVSECPLAGDHLRQGMDKLRKDEPVAKIVAHPIILMAEAYGLMA
jgi:glycerol-3-phosphate dehydrogenase subunit C